MSINIGGNVNSGRDTNIGSTVSNSPREAIERAPAPEEAKQEAAAAISEIEALSVPERLEPEQESRLRRAWAKVRAFGQAHGSDIVRIAAKAALAVAVPGSLPAVIASEVAEAAR